MAKNAADRCKFRVWVGDSYAPEGECFLCDTGVMHYQPPMSRKAQACGITIEQCTGLRDSEGTLIYEGDVLSRYHTGGKDVCWVIWHDGHWCKRYLGFSDDCDAWPLLMDCQWTRIVGNIHENPELVEVGR